MSPSAGDLVYSLIARRRGRTARGHPAKQFHMRMDGTERVIVRDSRIDAHAHPDTQEHQERDEVRGNKAGHGKTPHVMRMILSGISGR